MYASAILLILGWTICVHGTSLEPRIVGGNNVQEGMYPYHAKIAWMNDFICGGSIISEHFILTAAHCIYKKSPLSFNVTVGTIHLSSPRNPGITYSAAELIWHSQYNSIEHHNDIGLIRLNERILFINKRIELIPLSSIYSVAPGIYAVITGWGLDSTSGNVTSILQETQLKIISEKECKAKWDDLIESQICTFTKKDHGVCNGDSGGALAVNGVQVGIVSYGMACARGVPDVYTRVFSYISWIEQYTNSANDHIFLSDHNAANTFSKTWIPISLAILTYLHFFA